MSGKKLSILIPVYNVAEYLSECLDSIMLQINNKCEVIIYDDASTDKSREILLEYKENFPHIKLILSDKNMGVSHVRNTLFENSTGDYIWFIDSDDFLNNNSIDIVLENIDKKFDYDVIISDFIFFDRYKNQYNIEKCYMNSKGDYLSILTKLRKNYVWHQVFKRQIIEGIRFFDRKRFEDIIFVTDISNRVKNVKYLELPLVNYRYRVGSSVNTFKSVEYVEDYLFALNYRYEFIIDSSERLKKGYLKYKIFNSYASLVRNIDNDYKKHQDLKETIQVLKFIKSNYYNYFLGILSVNMLEIDIFRYINIRIKLHKIDKIFSKYDC